MTNLPIPKANIGDEIAYLVDQTNGTRKHDVVNRVHLVLMEDDKRWKVGYEVERNDFDYVHEETELVEIIKPSGRKWVQPPPTPKYRLNDLVTFDYDWRSAAGLITEIFMEFNSFEWKTYYYFAGIERPIGERDIKQLYERKHLTNGDCTSLKPAKDHHK